MVSTRLARLLRMVSLLQGHRAYNAAEIAIELDVSRRTVFRDLQMLEASRIPCFYHSEDKVSQIQLHFESRVARNVSEVVWHESQRVQWNDDGSMEFHVDVDGVREISWWILGYGDQCRVVEPPALVRLVAETAQRMAALYE